jgi:CBS domain-containing protein
MAVIPYELRTIAEELAKGHGRPQSATVRSLLSWFGQKRRGRWVVENVRSALTQLKLATEPDFDTVWVDDKVRFISIEEPTVSAAPRPELWPAEELAATSSEVPFVGGAVPDPTYKIGKLEAASRPVVAVTPDDPLERAVTLMMANGYSQLPAMSGEREVKGMITWESVARSLVLNGPSCKLVRHCMEKHREVSSDTSLFAAIPAIVESQYVLVRASDKRITGIVTAVDLSMQFRQLAEPFLLLGEIEHQIRRLIENRFTAQQLAEVKDPGDTDREITTVSDLSLGECIRILENPDHWGKLGVKLDRAEFVKDAHRIRRIRNDVMHFDPDPMGTADLLALRRFANFLSDLATYFLPTP